VASKTIVELVDDLDGGQADETVRFALDAVEYTIDLSAEHASELREGLADYISHARKGSGRPARSATKRLAAERREEELREKARQEQSRQATAEIRRLTTKTLTEPRQAVRASERDDGESIAASLAPVANSAPGPVGNGQDPGDQSGTLGPAPALVVPFMEAGR
jgi:hypothetical protein